MNQHIAAIRIVIVGWVCLSLHNWCTNQRMQDHYLFEQVLFCDDPINMQQHYLSHTSHVVRVAVADCNDSCILLCVLRSEDKLVVGDNHSELLAVTQHSNILQCKCV